MTLITLQRCKYSDQISGYSGGSGPSLTLLHGVGLCADAWEPMIPFLEKHFSLLVLDMPGHGKSPHFSTTPDLGDYTNAVAGVLSSAGGPNIVVGHSMGALIALDLATHHPTLVSSIAALNAVFRRSDEAKRSVAKRAADIKKNGVSDPNATLARWFGERPDGDVKIASNRCREWLTNVDPIGYCHAYNVFSDNDGPKTDQLRSLSCPSLFVTGADEPNSTPDMSRALAGHVPLGKAVIVPQARHMMPMTHPKIVSKLLIDWHRINEDAHAEH